jgi:hypothetical protein
LPRVTWKQALELLADDLAHSRTDRLDEPLRRLQEPELVQLVERRLDRRGVERVRRLPASVEPDDGVETQPADGLADADVRDHVSVDDEQLALRGHTWNVAPATVERARSGRIGQAHMRLSKLCLLGLEFGISENSRCLGAHLAGGSAPECWRWTIPDPPAHLRGA